MPLSDSIRNLADLTLPTRDAGDKLERQWSPESPPDVVAAAILASAFGSALKILTTSDIETVLNAVEGVIAAGDEHASEAMATGFLESLLAQASRGDIDFRVIVPMLGPESVKYCRAWDEFTGVRTDGLWEMRSE